VVLPIGQPVGDRGRGPAADFFARIALAQAGDHRYGSSLRARHQQQFVALGFETIGHGPVARHFVLGAAPLLEVVFVQQVQRDRAGGVFGSSHCSRES
jgi:hypothetical protein